MRLVTINRFPVKSCRGAEVGSAVVEPWGLAGDRRWMVVDEDDALVTARERPRMLLAVPTPDEYGALRLTGPDMPELRIEIPDPSDTRTVRIWRSHVEAAAADASADDWFSTLLDAKVRLVYLADPRQRPTSPRLTNPGDRVSFADGYPLLLTSTSSLDDLNDHIVTGPRADEGPLPMIRFRPNVVVSGSDPWDEDGWRRVRIGGAVFRSVKGCERCVMTTVHPETAAKGKEPIATLARIRRWDGGTWFGMNLVPDNPGATIRVGDEVEVLEAKDAPDGPPR